MAVKPTTQRRLAWLVLGVTVTLFLVSIRGIHPAMLTERGLGPALTDIHNPPNGGTRLTCHVPITQDPPANSEQPTAQAPVPVGGAR